MPKVEKWSTCASPANAAFVTMCKHTRETDEWPQSM